MEWDYPQDYYAMTQGAYRANHNEGKLEGMMRGIYTTSVNEDTINEILFV